MTKIKNISEIPKIIKNYKIFIKTHTIACLKPADHEITKRYPQLNDASLIMRSTFEYQLIHSGEPNQIYLEDETPKKPILSEDQYKDLDEYATLLAAAVLEFLDEDESKNIIIQNFSNITQEKINEIKIQKNFTSFVN